MAFPSNALALTHRRVILSQPMAALSVWISSSPSCSSPVGHFSFFQALTTDQQGFNMDAVVCYGNFWLRDK